MFGDASIPDDGLFATFDPRAETIDSGVERILPVLKIRLRQVLWLIAAEDIIENETYFPPSSHSAVAFEWLVRYQVLGQSKIEIARSVEKDHRHVGREINRAAELIDLTLRRERGGRPRRKHAVTPKPAR